MSSTIDIEETLPLTAPWPRHQETRPQTAPLMYTIVPFSPEQRAQFLAKVHDYRSTSKASRLAPDNFQDMTVHQVYDQHIRARDEDLSIHPTRFIVVDQADWDNDGVLLLDVAVATEHGDPSHVVGVSRCAVNRDEGAESMFNNLEILVLDWIEVKENEQRLWGGDDPYSNHRYFPVNPRTA